MTDDAAMVGLHIDSDPNEILQAIARAHEAGANTVQFFVYTNIKDRTVYNELQQYLKKHKIIAIVHLSYTINCSRMWSEHSPWIAQLIAEIQLASEIGARACVIHLGKQLDLSMEESINNMYTSLLYAHQHTKKSKVRILLETSTGQGSEIAYKLDDLAYLYRRFSKHRNREVVARFGICFDTCHVFSAGYDIRSKESREIFFDNFNELIGLNHIQLVHLNDSKVECGEKVDRHANIGKGYIGIDALKIIAILAKSLEIPLVLETPYDHIFDDLRLIL